MRGEKVKVLRSLRPIQDSELAQKTVRGQYRAGVADGVSVPGYLDEHGGAFIRGHRRRLFEPR